MIRRGFRISYIYLLIVIFIFIFLVWKFLELRRIYNKCSQCNCNEILKDELFNLRIFLKNFSYSLKEEYESLKAPISNFEMEMLFPAETHHNRLQMSDRIEQQLSFVPKFADRKVVLVYYLDDTLTTNALQRSNCEIDSCIFTTDRNRLHEADAVIFRQVPSDLRRPRSRPDQLWIIHLLESAKFFRKLSLNTYERVNWTATFRSDSDIVTPYEKFVSFKEIPLKPSRNYAEGKSKKAAWFVSRCRTLNDRMRYVQELRKFVSVDVYGTCGNLKCKKGERCLEMLNREYKFYLAFENSNCKDYITEKFFNALRHDVIPIVMGAHPDDYKRIAPPNSFIHVDEFNSPRQLAQYMKILDNNDHLYNEYFRWKDTGKFIDTKFTCRLCSMLQIAQFFPKWYKDVNSWWYDDQCILPVSGQVWSTWKNKTF